MMDNRKIYYIFVFTFFYVLTNSGLSFSELYKISQYFPIKTGNIWEYTTGERYFTSETYTNHSGHTGQLYGTDTYEYAQFMNNSGNGLMTVAQFERPEYELQEFTSPFILIPETMAIGETYKTTIFSSIVTTILESKEIITVPAGTFETICYKITIFNEEQKNFYTYLWFANGIGIIKIDREDVYPPNSGCLLVCRPDNNSTLVNTPAELTSYKINEESKNVVITPILNLLLRQAGYGTVVSAGQVWVDRNLGASRVAQSMTDTEAYGDLYQWGRLADGHQNRTSLTTSVQSKTDVPGHDSFIAPVADLLYDWRNPQNDNLWQGGSGVNNPCPAGFRLPTETEWETERASWSSYDSAGAFASPLKLPLAGNRLCNIGTLERAGSDGYYWSSTVSDSNSRYLYFQSGNANIYSANRAYGFSVRCIKD